MKFNVETTAGSGTVKGTPCGLFFIHRPLGWLVDEWYVSHKRTGFRFPCKFDSFAKAREFARRVSTLMDFEAIDVGRPTLTNNVGVWTKGAPSKKQADAVLSLMKELCA